MEATALKPSGNAEAFAFGFPEDGGDGLAGFPIGRRTPRGTSRWYIVHAPNREQSTAAKLKKLIPSELLEDAFVLQKERWRKYGDEWRLYPVPLYQDYFFVVTKDAAALDRELSQLSFPVSIAKGNGNFCSPMATQAQEWYERMTDETHTIRSSTGVIVDGELDVQRGPLVGQEASITKVNRAKRYCSVRVGEDGSSFEEYVPLVIPYKS